jgi:hypothetical protein
MRQLVADATIYGGILVQELMEVTSGGSADISQLKQLIKLAKKYDATLVTLCPDRLSRDASRLAEIKRFLQVNAVPLKYEKEIPEK